MKERIFISYKRVDKERVFAIKDGIEQATGEKCWIDLEGIESNAQFAAKIMTAIDRCDVFLFMRSKEHNKITDLEKDWTYRELNFASSKGKNIIFLKLDDSPSPDWATFLFPHKQETDTADPDKLARLYKDLRKDLGVGSSIEPNSPELEQAKREALPKVAFQVGELEFMASEKGSGVAVVKPINKDLTEIHIPSQIMYGKYTYDVDTIGDRAFSKCANLSSITIPNSVTRIEKLAFAGCKNLISVTIPNSVTSIGDYAFADCYSLTAIIIPNSVKRIEDFAFSYCTNLTSITIPNSVTSIGEKAFSSCKALTSITIPNSVMSIGERAFAWCESLTSISIPNSVTSIGWEAFNGCSSLEFIKIPKVLTNIGSDAFPEYTKVIRE